MQRRRRNSLRLEGFDYSQAGEYFVTVRTYGRRRVFGEILSGRMNISEEGTLAKSVWNQVPMQFQNIRLGMMQVMPDHIHGIVEILTNKPQRVSFPPPPLRMGLINQTHTNEKGSGTDQQSWILMKRPDTQLGKVIRAFKARTTRLIRQRINPSFRWHRGFYDRVMRDDIERYFVEQYIELNPLMWELRHGPETMSLDEIRSRLQNEHGFRGQTLDWLVERERDHITLMQEKEIDEGKIS